jgi:hypothetical protein
LQYCLSELRGWDLSGDYWANCIEIYVNQPDRDSGRIAFSKIASIFLEITDQLWKAVS